MLALIARSIDNVNGIANNTDPILRNSDPVGRNNTTLILTTKSSMCPNNCLLFARSIQANVR
jgi:hypothetical protein